MTDEKNYKDLLIYFTRYIHTKLIKILILYYHELIEAIEEHGGKKYLIVDDFMLDKVLNKIREIISIEKFDNTKILIDTDDELPDDIALMLMKYVVKGGNNFYLQLFQKKYYHKHKRLIEAFNRFSSTIKLGKCE